MCHATYNIEELMGSSSSIIDHPKITPEFLGPFIQDAFSKMFQETTLGSPERLDQMMKLMDKFELILLYERYFTKEISMLKIKMMLNDIIELKALGETGHFVVEVSKSLVTEQLIADFEANMMPLPTILKEELDSLEKIILSQSEKKSERVVNLNKETIQYTKERFDRIMAAMKDRFPSVDLVMWK